MRKLFYLFSFLFPLPIYASCGGGITGIACSDPFQNLIEIILLGFIFLFIIFLFIAIIEFALWLKTKNMRNRKLAKGFAIFGLVILFLGCALYFSSDYLARLYYEAVM